MVAPNREDYWAKDRVITALEAITVVLIEAIQRYHGDQS